MKEPKIQNKNPNKKDGLAGLVRGSKLPGAIVGSLTLAGGIAASVLTLGTANWVVSQVVEPAKPDPMEEYNFTPYELDADFIEVVFPTTGGRLLQGWLLYHPGERRVVITAHGYRGRKEEMLSLGVFLWKAGFNVLLFNYRGHGSERVKGEILTLGDRELEDFQAAVTFVYNHFEQQGLGEPIIGALGGSMGAAVALVAAARDERIKAVWADSSFTSRLAVISHHWRKTSHLPVHPVLKTVDWLFTYRTGHALTDFSPIDEVAKIAPRPIYFLHGGADPMIPTEHVYALYEAALGPKSLWVEEGLSHCGIYFKNRPEYRRRLVSFFEEWLIGETVPLPFVHHELKVQEAA